MLTEPIVDPPASSTIGLEDLVVDPSTVTQFTKRYVKGTTPNVLGLLSERIVELLDETKEFYAPWLSIVQSSGTGKTRAIFELAQEKKASLFYVCYRDKNDTGYPLATHKVFDFLHMEPDEYDDDNELTDPDLRLYCRYVGFFYYVWCKEINRSSGIETNLFEGGYLFGNDSWDIKTLNTYEKELYNFMKFAKIQSDVKSGRGKYYLARSDAFE